MSEEVKPQEEAPKTYTLTVHCDNCDTKGEAEIPKGTVFLEANNDRMSNAVCEMCGCARLSKSSSSNLTPYFPTVKMYG